MPKLQIMSIYEERKRTFAAELARACAERERFRATLVARFGKETTDAMRQEAWRTGDVILGRGNAPPLSPEISTAAKRLRTLDRKVMAVRKKIRTPDCWFRESPGPVSVLERAGLSWRMVHEQCADGWLPISGVLWLLKVLRATEQDMRIEEQSPERAAAGLGPCRFSEKWRRRLRRRRRRLTLLLRTAVTLEEDVRWRFRL